MKTGKQVQSDIIALLKNSALPNAVNGKIYRFGYRPRDSKAEDIIVAFTTGIPDQIETGVVTINIFIPDIEAPDTDNGVMLEDGKRSEELEIAAAEFVKSLTVEKSNYKFNLRQTIYTEAELEINQHFIVIKLGYDYYYTGGEDISPIRLTGNGDIRVIRKVN
ncbi:MAG: hypothetical protein LBO74_08520 [Candidatus Symbiothrix sp.]|jgi:hypothetical protein|nr:hypothetical protein [Candidatus Symbiothrix sp.]